MLTAFISAYTRTIGEDVALERLRVRIKELRAIFDNTPPRHEKARSQGNPNYPERFKVPNEKVLFKEYGGTEWPEYRPTAFTAQVAHRPQRIRIRMRMRCAVRIRATPIVASHLPGACRHQPSPDVAVRPDAQSGGCTHGRRW